MWRRDGYPALIVTVIARITLVTLGGLLLWAVLPVVVGWQTTVVMSGSMEPRIQTGDVVVTREVPAEQLQPGHVLLVEDPDHDGGLRLHRFENTTNEGLLILRGDANAEPDSTSVAPEAVEGVGVLRVPWVGHPAVWINHSHYLLLASTLLISAGLVVLATLHQTGPPPGASKGASAGRAQPVGPRHRRRVKPAVATLAGSMVMATLVIYPSLSEPAWSNFTSTTTTTATFTAAEAPSPACEETLRADVSNMLFGYRLNEPTGSGVAEDFSNSASRGTYRGSMISDTSTPQACPRDPGGSYQLDGSTSYVSIPTTYRDPQLFTVEVWFKTTTAGGNLIGFNQNQPDSSRRSESDRNIYMTNTGQIGFGVSERLRANLIISPASYNDGQWHHAAATLSRAGMNLYVDGNRVANDPTITNAGRYDGFWRIGQSNFSGASRNEPTNSFFTGNLRFAAVYDTALSDEAIANRYFVGRP